MESIATKSTIDDIITNPDQSIVWYFLVYYKSETSRAANTLRALTLLRPQDYLSRSQRRHYKILELGKRSI
jgi:hypothetical protein